MQAAARILGLELHVLNASTERDFNEVFAKLVQLQAGGLVIGSDPLFSSWSEQLAALALHHAVPTIYQNRDFAVAGGLLSYGATLGRHTAWPAIISAGFSRAKSRPTCRSS